MHDNYFDSKEFKDDLSKYEEACATGGSVYLDSDALTDIAEYYHSKGMLDRAEAAADYALSIFHGATSPLVFKARMALLNGNDSTQAEAFAEQIADKSDLDYYYIKAEILVADGRAEAAHLYLESCEDDVSDDDYPDYVLDVATIFADYDQMYYAQLWLDKSEETDLADYRELQGRIDYGEGRFDKSEQLFNGLIDENPFATHYWNQLASTQFMQNRFQESMSSSEYALAIRPDDEDALLNKANALLNLENYEDACKYYKKYADVSPNKDIGELYQGVSLFNMNRLQEAIQHFEASERHLTPQSTCALELYQELAFAHSQLGHTSIALQYVEKAEARHGDPDEMQVLRGHILLESHRVREADAHFRKALQQSGYSPNIVLRVAISLYDNRYTEEAYGLLNTLVANADEQWANGYAYLAMCAREMGHKDEYMKYLQIAVSKNPFEAKNVLRDLFPEGMDPADYYAYAQAEPPIDIQ